MNKGETEGSWSYPIFNHGPNKKKASKLDMGISLDQFSKIEQLAQIETSKGLPLNIYYENIMNITFF